MKAQLQLQHRIDVIRATKKPILQHLIKMNIDSGSRVTNDFIRSPTASSKAQSSKIMHQNTAYNFKSTYEQNELLNSRENNESPRRNNDRKRSTRYN